MPTNTDNSNKQLRTAFVGALITTLASGLASLVVEETKGYIARKRKRQEEAEAEFRKEQTCATNGGPMTQPQTCSKTVRKAENYTHFAVAYDSFLEALLSVCRSPVYAKHTYDDPVDQLDKHNGKWYIRNMPRKITGAC